MSTCSYKVKLPELKVVEFFNGLQSIFGGRVPNESETAIRPRKVNQQTELVNLSDFFENWDQVIFGQITRNSADEHLAAFGRGRAQPVGRWTSEKIFFFD